MDRGSSVDMIYKFSSFTCVWCLVCLTVCISAGDIAPHQLDEFLRQMDNRVRPDEDGPPVVVKCNVYVVSFGSINMKDMDYTINIYLRQIWVDERFQFDESRHAKPLLLDANTTKSVWIPDIFFPNEKRANFHDITIPNRMMKVYHNGTIVYSIRLTMTIACSMSLYKFPMDDQQCFFKMESYSYSTDDLVLEWYGTDPVEVDDEDLELPQFDLTSVKTSDCIKTYKTGSFPCLKATFYLHRQFGFYLLQTYIPTILIVILSWVSFWLHVDAVPARISLGVTTVLTMATQLSGSRENAPKVSYPKALDVWMAACMFFVFAALLEYAFVNVLTREKKTQKIPRAPSGGEQLTDLSPVDPSESMERIDATQLNHDADPHTSNGGAKYTQMHILDKIHSRKTDRQSHQADTAFQGSNPRTRKRRTRSGAAMLDELSKIVFPVAFALFNILYWAIYTAHDD